MNPNQRDGLLGVSTIYFIWQALRLCIKYLWPAGIVTTFATFTGRDPSKWSETTINTLLIISLIITVPLNIWLKWRGRT